MIANRIIILPLFLPEGFPADFEKQTALFLSKKNKVIIFRPYEGTTLFRILTKKQKFIHFKKQLKTLKKNLISFPIVYLIPFHRFSFIRKLNYKIALKEITLFTKIIGKKPILWIFYPQFENLVGEFKEKLVIYDCVDYHSSPCPKIDKFKKEQEKKLLNKVNVVFTISSTLHYLKNSFHPKVFQVPQGCNIKLFLKTKKSFLPRDLKKIPRPRIGFIGNINYRLDFELIKNLVLNNPNWSFVFIGPCWGDPKLERIISLKKNLKFMKKVKNIYFIKQKGKKQLISYIDGLDVGMIPYNVNYEFARYCYPMKTFEYFCRGKPIVSTSVEALKPLQPLVKIVKNSKGFEKEIKKILKQGWSKKYIKKQKQLAIANSWQAKIEKITKILKKEFPELTNE